MILVKTLAINLKYYHKKYKLSQEKFAEILDSTLSYFNQINKYDKTIKSQDLVTYKKTYNKL